VRGFEADRPSRLMPAKRCGTAVSSHNASRPGGKYEYPCLIYPNGRRAHHCVVKSVDEPTGPSDQGNDKMNAHLTIRPVLAAAAFAAVVGMTSALSVAQAGDAGAERKTLGASGPPEPSPFVDYDHSWLTGTEFWNAGRAIGWRM
jgi:hypothetical protein